MENKHERKVSLLEGDELFFNKVLSRDSSLGCSSRVLYYRIRNAEGVPFKWEMQPGTPKEPPKEDVIPPLSPPPAVLSLGLPKPCIDIQDPPTKASILKSKLMFWKQNKKSQGVENLQIKAGSKENDGFVNMEFCSSDGEEFMASPPCNSSSTSSSSSNYSFSLSNNNPRDSSQSSSSSSSRVQSPVREKIYGGCSPWHVTSVFARLGRRI